MKKSNLNAKDRLMVYILSFIAIALLSTSFLIYFQTKQLLMSNYILQKEQIESEIVSSLRAVDSGFAMLEKHLKEDMEKGILIFRDEFEKAGGRPENISLEVLKAKMGERYDFVIIDRETTIIKTTIPDTLNFNYMNVSRDLGDRINGMRTSGVIQHERFSTYSGTGYLSIFAYMPAQDEEYLLELAYTQPDLGDYVTEFRPVKITSQLLKINPEIVSIRVFDNFGTEFIEDGTNRMPTKDSLAIVEKARRERRFEQSEGNIVKTYLYVDLKQAQNVLSDNSKTVEIVYDTTIFINELKKIAFSCLLIGFAVVAAMVFMIARIRNGFSKIAQQQSELEEHNRSLEELIESRTRELITARETIQREKEVFESILNDTLSGYFDFNFVSGELYFSSGFKRMLGYEEHELGNTFREIRRFLYPEDVQQVTDCFKRYVESGGTIPFYCQLRYKTRDGSTVWLIAAGHVLEWGPDHKPVQMIGCHINITEQKMLEKSLKEERELLKATLFSMGDGVITTDREGNVGIVNASAEKLTGWTREEVEGKPFNEVFRFSHTNTDEQYAGPLDQILKTGELIQDQNQLILLSREGHEIPIENSTSPIRDEGGNINGAVLVFRDYTEKKEKQARIEYLSFHDQLTGLYNRRFFEDELIRLDTVQNLPLSIIMVDVNGLKLINDAFGHSTGDLALREAAAIIQEECQEYNLIARLGGDEFVMLLPRTNQDNAEMLVKRIYSAFEKKTVGNISLSVSCGWGVKQEPGENMANVLKLAEDHMYRRKLSESKSMHYKTIDIIIRTLHGKSERERKHSERVGLLCEAIAIAMNMDPEDVKEFRTIGLMHDIGKIAIDLRILDKEGPLNALERAELERHPELGYQILRSINEFAKLAEYTLSHHERWDGTGYPRKLKGDEIPLEARIIAIADAYDAMTSDRPYRRAMDKEAAVMELIKESGKQFDPDIAVIFAEKVLGVYS